MASIAALVARARELKAELASIAALDARARELKTEWKNM
jgi:hypothetical protein